MRGQRLGVEDILIADLGCHQDKRFQSEGDEVLGALALNHAFPGLVQNNAAVVAVGGDEGIRHGGRLVVAPLQYQNQGRLLAFRHLECERITSFHKRLVIAHSGKVAKGNCAWRAFY